MAETVRHVKTGGVYAVVGTATLQWSAARRCIQTVSGDPVEGTELTLYMDQKFRLWARPTSEFRDGRFETLDTDDAPDIPLSSELFDKLFPANLGGKK